MDEVTEDFKAGRRTLRLDDKHLEAEMDELKKMVCKSLRRAPRRRAVPRWSLPSEIWLMLACPNYRVRKPHFIGITAGELTICNTVCFELFGWIITAIIRTQVSPMLWHLSDACTLGKGIGEGGAAWRWLHLYDRVGSRFRCCCLVHRRRIRPRVSWIFDQP